MLFLGAFLLPYLLMLFLCGIPLFFMETCLGQFSSFGCLTIFRIAPLFKGVGYAIIIVNLICSLYYNVIIAYPVLFIIKSFAKALPWMHCNNEWNTPHCVEVKNTQLFQLFQWIILFIIFNHTKGVAFPEIYHKCTSQS